MAKANCTIVEAPQGEGKTNTATAIAVDKYFDSIYAVESPEGTQLPVRPYKLDTVELQPLDGINTEPMLVQIPYELGWQPKSTERIFANYHLFGIEYMYADPETVLNLINTGIISSGTWVVDEAYITGEARRGMNTLNLVYTWLAQQMRKRDIELYLLVQHGRFIDWRFRYIAKRKILCRYDEKTNMIRLLVQNLAKGTEKTLRYYAPNYWKFFDSFELPPMPDLMVQKAGAWAAAGKGEKEIKRLLRKMQAFPNLETGTIDFGQPTEVTGLGK